MNGAEHLLGAAALARHGPRVALLWGAQSLSFVDFAAQVRRSCGALQALGIAPGDRVLLLMRDTPQFAAAWLGAVRAGAIAIALNNRLSEADYRHILDDSAAQLVIVEDVFASAKPDLATELSGERRVMVAGEALPGLPSWSAQLGRAGDGRAFDADQEAPALALYTSGTTGRPKGIIHAHRAFLSLGNAFRAIGLAQGDCVFTTSKFFFAYGLEHGLLAPLAMGMTSAVFADWPGPEAVLDIVARHRPAALFSVPTMYRRLLAEPVDDLHALRSVRYFVAGGERLSAQLIGQWRQAVGGEILNLYGMSETFCACMMTPPGTSDGARTGKPFPGVELRLMPPADDETMSGTGVLWVRHPAQARAYANLPQETREQFSDGWFCSRDLFRRDAQGFYVHQGRSDELLKVAGQWVQPGELEEVATLAPSVAEAACVPVIDADGLERLALFVTARGDSMHAQRDAEAACERMLPRHKRPKWVRTVAELPRTATGKVQRYKLRETLERELRHRD